MFLKMEDPSNLEENFQRLLEVFNFLASPYEDKALDKPTVVTNPSGIFQLITDFCQDRVEVLESSKSLLNTDSSSQAGTTCSWKLACYILSSLVKLKLIVEQLEQQQPPEEKSIDVLSLQNQIIVQKSVELCVGFGISPYLLPGLGVPPKLRKMSASVSQFILDAQTAPPYVQFLRLSHSLEILLECSNHPTLNTLIAQKYSSDLLAGLLHVCRSPILPPKPEAGPGALSLEEYNDVMLVRSRLSKTMTNFLKTSPKPILINSLFLVGAAERPRWIGATCNSLLCDLILSQNGLALVSSTMIDVSGSCDTWKLMRIIAGLMKHAVAKTPSQVDPENLRNLARQSVQMITQWESSFSSDSYLITKLPIGVNVDLIQIGLFCGLTLIDLDYPLGRSEFWENLFSHVFSLNSSSGKDGNLCYIGQSVVYGEIMLGLVNPMSISLPFKRLQPVFSVFLQIFVACDAYLSRPVQEPELAGWLDQLQNKLQDVLVSLLEMYGSAPREGSENPVNLCEFMMALILNYENCDEKHGAPVLNKFDFAWDETSKQGKICRVAQTVGLDNCDYGEVFENYLNHVCSCLGGRILKSERLKGIWGKLFKELLGWGTERHVRKWKSDELPTRLTGREVKASLFDCQRFISFKLLGELGDEEKVLEEFGSSQSMEETLSFLQLLLSKFTSEVVSPPGGGSQGLDSSQLIVYALGIIGALIEAALASAAQLSNQFVGGNSDVSEEICEFWKSMEVFVPHLRKLSEISQRSLVGQGIPEMASDLLLRIATRGESNKNKSEYSIKTRFQVALEDVASPMVHVKGHGLLELRKLLLQRDHEALENQLKLVELFSKHLRHNDSYIYLMAIQGMAAVADKFHGTVVPTLIREYDLICAPPDVDSLIKESSQKCQRHLDKMDDDERLELRMKVGEVLVKVIQKLNELAPSYRTPLTNVLFRLMRDEEPLIRMSALANLAELCHLLKFSLSAILTEVWFCVQSILSTEKDIHVRRGALHVLVLLLKGVQTSLTAGDILSDPGISEHLRDVRRLLTRLEQTEKDLVAKTHAQLALQELELIVKKLLTPTSSLSYKIQVLNL